MIEYGCTNANHCQKVKTWWIWRVISIIAENKPHAHHKTHFHTMKVFDTRLVYSLAIEVFHWSIHLFQSYQRFQAIRQNSWTDPFRKSSTTLRQSFLSFLHKIQHGALTRSNSYPHFPRISASNAGDHDFPFGAHSSETNYLLCRSMF